MRELLARVRAQVRRDDWHANSSEEFSFGEVTVRPRQRRCSARAGASPGRRASSAAALSRGPPQRGGEPEQLLRDVWGYHQLSVTRTVDNYIAKLRTELEPKPHEPRYIITVHGSGYQLLL